MESSRNPWLRATIGTAIAALVYCYVWPGLWIYSGDGEKMVRVNRLTGTVERASELGWGTAEELSERFEEKFDREQARLASDVKDGWQSGLLASYAPLGESVTVVWKSGRTETVHDPKREISSSLERAGVRRDTTGSEFFDE